ncbi:unnamed protein product [Pieris brassicae]|uniref:Dendritic cell-specific transmembrane protein-like domain-containing protein n=1 Tax=Pieris brassicae TaxID=7116 RepID=A0A9P0TKX2_PIEBR|nr:unnamed protein product [Pieris brassicae]
MAGFCLGQAYFHYLLKFILPNTIGLSLGIIISVCLGIGNTISIQIRCISVLLLPMYCGKAGRGILKAFVLAYVVAGPITNMAFNAKEVVRVFACSTQLSCNITRLKYNFIANPFRRALLAMNPETDEFKGTLRSIRDIIKPIEIELENNIEIQNTKVENDIVDDMFYFRHKSDLIQEKYRISAKDPKPIKYWKKYIHKIELRCQRQIDHAVISCMRIFSSSYNICYSLLPIHAGIMCWPLMLPNACHIDRYLGSLCKYEELLDPGLGEGYTFLKKASVTFIENLHDVNISVREIVENDPHCRLAKESAEQLIDAFKEKYSIMQGVILVVNVCLALLFLRLVTSAHTYHDLYLTNIDYDNVYITRYFKRIDQKRRDKHKCTLLPLKKMERNRYIDVYLTSYIPSERSKLFTQILKLTLEAITATTFVMLDRLFYEALDVVRQYADSEHYGIGDLDVLVEGKGFLAGMVRKIIDGLGKVNTSSICLTNKECRPQPHAILPSYYFKIYGGYLWILALLYLNPYTLRLRRLICGFFYPHREKQRILHLYNDILKKRLRMQKTLRKKAVQAVRAHYLSGENLLSLRIRFPQLLGWLGALPLARMKCLICEEIEPNLKKRCDKSWHNCSTIRCPFVYCDECWKDIGSSCLACDPALNELSDVDSLSDDQPQRY